jgi:predicted HAD superfamily Cof-like phosphohydrolase
MGFPIGTRQSDPRALNLQHNLIREEYQEFLDSTDCENELKEMADIMFVLYQYASLMGYDLDEAMRRVYISNMSKLDDNGNPIRREDGKVLKGLNYLPPDLSDLV